MRPAYCLCARGDRLDRSAGKRAYARAAAVPLGLWHAAMSLETPRYGLQLEVSRARLVQFTQHLVFSDHPCGYHSNGGFISARVAAIWHLERSDAICHHLPGHGRASRHARLHSRTRADRARLAHIADASDLPPDAQLLYLEGDFAWNQRRLGKLGQTGTHRQRAGAGVIAKRACGLVAHASRVLMRIRLGPIAPSRSRTFNPADSLHQGPAC